MSLKNSSTTYGSVAKFFHWFIFLLLFFMIIYGYFLEEIPKDYQSLAYNVHKLIGLSILILMLLRAFWALINLKPILPIRTRTWERWAERMVHLSLYVVIIAMPLFGWIGSSAAGRPPHIGEYNLLLPVPQNKPLVEASFSMHNTLAIVIIVLFCLHVGAAFFHHFIRKDDVLRRMLPNSSS